MFEFEYLLQVIDKAFRKAAVVSTEALRDDRKVRRAASEAHDALPFPLRLAIKVSIGKPGFERFVLQLRDLMLRDGASAPTALDRKLLRQLYAQAPDFVRETLALPATAAAAPPPTLPSRPLGLGAAMPAPEPPSSAAWHVIRTGRQSGPYSDREFLGLAEDGRLLPTDLVWRDGLDQWIRLTDLPAFTAARDLGHHLRSEPKRRALEPAA